jgi:endonuclease/exonuclease/phosphatase family metal-dependent hydrolase
VAVEKKGTKDGLQDVVGTKQARLRILSWNIAMLPLFEVLYSSDQRAKAIAKVLKGEEYDVIVFQEAFSPVSRRIIYSELGGLYPNQYGPANARPGLKINSGLWVLSKMPLSIIQEIEFRDCGGIDRLSRKGALMLEGSVNNMNFQIIAPHLHSDESIQLIRSSQLKEIYENLIRPYSDPEIPQIICGDFNIDRNHTERYQEILDILGCEDGALSGEVKITFGFATSSINFETDNHPRQLDYVLTRNSSAIQRIQRRVSVLSDYWCKNSNSLSDHYGVEAVIEFMATDDRSLRSQPAIPCQVQMQ